MNSLDKRAALIEQLHAYQPLDARDAAVKETFIAFVFREIDCFERTLPHGHVTGSSWLVDSGGERVLLTHHRKLDKWLQLGGHADGDPDVLSVAIREAEEESGLAGIVPVSPEIFDLDIHPIPQRNGVPEHLHYDVRYVLCAAGGDEYRISEESHELRWVPLGELEALSTEWSLLRMKAKFVGGFIPSVPTPER